MIVMDEETCMVDTARYYTDFLAHESCGKCVPCREGLRQMLIILDNITRGRGKEDDIDLLIELSEFMKEAALCALGKTAANPVLSTILHFRDEYEAHIREKRCPAGVCKDLIVYHINPAKCIGCGACEKNCLANAIYKTSGDLYSKETIYVINQDDCIKCGSCITACPKKARAIEKRPSNAVAQTI
jgi:NADH-quinone oxidoreductase subunit F